MSEYKTDIEIAHQAKLKPIREVAAQLGLTGDDIHLYGDYKAKVKMSSVRRIFAEKRKEGKLILVSAITPTPAGEGKTTVSIGLTQALRRIGQNASAALREPSLGPVLGRKGGAAGGGYSQVLPMEDINLHFTGDLHAITSAHNLISAALDNHLHFNQHKKRLSLKEISWPRVMDMNDRVLREMVVGLGGKTNGITRETGFDITAASEIMAILCLARSYSELKEKIGNILLGLTEEREPFLVKDLNIEGAVTALLKDALQPNLVQTIENGPAFVHGGPFANIAQGTNSILATKLALQLSDYVVTEAGFGFDLGAEKFFDIVSPYGGLCPSAVVLVATARALKMHGGVSLDAINQPDPGAILRGRGNLEKHIENMRKFGMHAIVAVNRFAGDTDEEIQAVEQICRDNHISYAVVNVWAEGGKGGTDLAEKVVEMVKGEKCRYHQLYDWHLPVEEKIKKIAQEIYGAAAVDYTSQARKNLKDIQRLGYDQLPICMAKTQNSLSDNPKLLGRPKDFLVTVREIIISAGAGFLVPLTGNILRMPGLPRVPAAEKIDIDDEGNISGLF